MVPPSNRREGFMWKFGRGRRSALACWAATCVALCRPAAGQTFIEFTLPNADSTPTHITVGPDGALWVTELDANKIGRITLDGKITEFPIPTTASQPYG